MRRETLLDFFDDFSALDDTFLVHDDGYRTRAYTYAQVASLAHLASERLRAAGLQPGDPVVIWSENRPEWIIALWGAILGGFVVVPIDFRVSPDFLWRVRSRTDARVVLVGDDVQVDRVPAGVSVWAIHELSRGAAATGGSPRAAVTPETTAEIIFTSGATAEPKGVVITHRNILANVVPIEREVAK